LTIQKQDRRKKVELKAKMRKISGETWVIAGSILLAALAIHDAGSTLHARMDTMQTSMDNNNTATNARIDNLQKSMDENFREVREKVDNVVEQLHKLEIALTVHVAGHPHTPAKSTSTGAPATAPGDDAHPAYPPAKNSGVVGAPLPPEKLLGPGKPKRQNPTIPEPENLT